MPSDKISNILQTSVPRRTILKVGALASASVLAAPFVRPTYAASRIRISNFGGFFEEAFVKSVYPEFTKVTGIEVESLSQSGSAGSQFLVQLSQAVKAGQPPMDVCCVDQGDVIRGWQRGLWSTVDESKFKNLGNLMDGFVQKDGSQVYSVGATAFYYTLVVNQAEFPTLPDSWAELWRPREAAWGVQGGGLTSLLDITANLYFGGPSILDTEAGIDKVVGKIAELKPNAKLWWTDEGSMQSALQNEDVVGGIYLHDVSMIMKKDGTNIASIFPKEGGLLGYTGWCVPKTDNVSAETIAWLDWSASPECSQFITRNVGTAPVVQRSKLNLTDEEFAAASSTDKPMLIAYEQKVKHADYMSAHILKMLSQ